MPKIKEKDFTTHYIDNSSETEISQSVEPTIVEEVPVVKEKVGKCKNPKMSRGFRDGDLFVTLFPDSGDSCEYRIGNGEWQKYSHPFPLLYQKATVYVEFKSTNPDKNDSDVIEVKLR